MPRPIDLPHGLPAESVPGHLLSLLANWSEMRDRIGAIVFAFLCCAVSLAGPGSSEAAAQNAVSDKAFEAVITAQIEAFGRGDAAAAHQFASPGIKTKFPDPEQFLTMVRRNFSPLIHPRSTRFVSSGDSGLGPMETVSIIDGDGVAWTAVYTFEQVDGAWRITGCSLLKEPEVGT